MLQKIEKRSPDQDNQILKQFEEGKISTEVALRKLNSQMRNIKKSHVKNLKVYNPEVNEVLKELDHLIGLKKIKNLVKEYLAFVKVQNLRKDFNLKNQSQSLHMIFKGNPGTGKTTVARIMAKAFCRIGFLEKGELKEVQRADLVGEYIGRTAKKTKKVVEDSLGGVLFIDEAYALSRGGNRDFGKESIDTLVKCMEDYRDKLIIIFAGYPYEMEEFIKTNPGLRSRVSIHLNFPDYSVEELTAIAELMFDEHEYLLNKNGKTYLRTYLQRILHDEKGKGNARTVRNIVEKTIRKQADRLSRYTCISRNDLLEIKMVDLQKGSIIDD